MRTKLFPILLIIISFMTSCMSYRAMYDIKLDEVERPENAQERYGKQTITRFEEEGQTKYSFEDDLLKIIWFPTSSRFYFILTNKTEHSIKIIWDEAVYVDTNGMSKRVVHSGVNYADRNNHQPPSTIVRGATVSDIILPTDNIYYQYYGGWKELPLFPSKGVTTSEVSSKALAYKGKKVQIMLPIKIEEIVNEYIFSFVIEGFKVK